MLRTWHNNNVNNIHYAYNIVKRVYMISLLKDMRGNYIRYVIYVVYSNVYLYLSEVNSFSLSFLFSAGRLVEVSIILGSSFHNFGPITEMALAPMPVFFSGDI